MRADPGRRLRDLAHLARRFFWSLRSPAPDRGDEAWLMQLLTPAEQELYEAQPVVDRAHSVSCAIAARDDLVSPTDEAIVASALHDVGKAGARLGTFGRVLATIVPTRLHERWAGSGDGRRARLAHYAAHDRIGADLLREAGSADLVVAWAGEHHLPEDQWSLDPEVGRVLLAADG